MIRFNCDSCGQRYKSDEYSAGDEVECAKCGAAISITNMPSLLDEAPIQTIQKTVVEPVKPKEIKMPTLTLPASLGKKGQEPEEASEKSAGTCPKCGATLQFANAVICIECGQNVKLGMNVNTVKNAKVAGKLGMAIGIGAAAALLSGGIWAGIAVWTKLEISWIACLIGLITGMAVCLVTPERSMRMGALAVMLACVGLLTGKMLTAEYMIRDTFKSFASMTKKFSKASGKMGKQFQNMALMGMLADEMRKNGEINDPYDNEELEKLAPKAGEKPSKSYQNAWEKVTRQSKHNLAEVKKKFGTLSAADKARLQKRLERVILLFPLQQEMIDNGEIAKPDDKWKDLAPKNLKEKPSNEYLAAVKKYGMQLAENTKKVKEKLYTLSDAETKRLQGKIGSTLSNQISYWQKLKMVTSWWDILWFMLAISTAWGLGNGTSNLSRRGL